jgi:thymidylate synthase ThyX
MNISHKKIKNPKTKKVFVDVYSNETSFGGIVYLIVPRTTIGPEELAMIQALYSRSPASMLVHLQEVSEKGAEKFMDTFFKGYGHKSIGDLGNVLLAYEGVSMLAAKAIQDSQLYNGQEASTRYINFDKQIFLERDQKLNLISSVESGTGIQEEWREFYSKILPITQEHLSHLYPFDAQKDNKDFKKADYERAIKARAFDIMRGFLPAGATTMVAWWTSISHAIDHLSWLRCHVLGEVQEIAQKTQELLEEIYPASFEGRKIYEENEEYKKFFYEQAYYLQNFSLTEPKFKFNIKGLKKINKKIILERPTRQELHYSIGELGTISFAAPLDFASFRDQQRHRSLIQRHGLLTDKMGLHDWYINNLPETYQEGVKTLIKRQCKKIQELPINDFEKQYFFPMGMKIPTKITGPLGKMIYFLELRCQKTVHPTLHENAFLLATKLREKLAKKLDVKKEDIPLFIDEEVGGFSLKRGTQTILKDGKELS